MGKCSLLTKLAKCTLNIDSVSVGEKLSLKKGLKQCHAQGDLKCSQNTKKNKKTLKVSFKID